MLKLRKCEEELASGGDTFEKHKNLYDTYFTVKETPPKRGGRKVSLNEQAVNAYINGYSGSGSSSPMRRRMHQRPWGGTTIAGGATSSSTSMT